MSQGFKIYCYFLHRDHLASILTTQTSFWVWAIFKIPLQAKMLIINDIHTTSQQQTIQNMRIWNTRSILSAFLLLIQDFIYELRQLLKST